METAIVSLICIVLIVIGGMTLSQGFLTSADTTSVALEELGVRDEEIMRTELSPQTANATEDGYYLYVTLDNRGQTKLADFANWDVIVQYYDDSEVYYTRWLPFNSGAPANNEWTINGIYYNEIPETFEPDIVNPGETVEIRARIFPPVGDNTTNMVVTATPNGIPASIYFTH